MHQALIFKFATGFWGGFVFGKAGYDVLGLDLAKAPQLAEAVAKIVNATDPDLSKFRKHGGKLIQYHGWNDPAIPAQGSIVYYEDVRAKLLDVDGFYRLYMIPGMLHCGGGLGPSNVAWLRRTCEPGWSRSQASEGACRHRRTARRRAYAPIRRRRVAHISTLPPRGG